MHGPGPAQEGHVSPHPPCHSQSMTHQVFSRLVQPVVVVSLILATHLLHAQDYFVSANGDDNDIGTAPLHAWQTLAKVNSLELQPGDTVSLHGGEVFAGSGLAFDAHDAGSASRPVIIHAYGSGRAEIRPSDGRHGITIVNTAGLVISDLLITGPGLAQSDRTSCAGIQAYCDRTDGHKLRGLSIHDVEIQSFHMGIKIGAWDASMSGFSDVTIASLLIHDCVADGINVYGFFPSSEGHRSHANLLVSMTEVRNCRGDPTLEKPADTSSGNGILIGGTAGALIENCYAHHNGGGSSDDAGGGPCGIWSYESDHVIIQHCLVHDQRTTPGAMDGGGFDIDGGCNHCVIQYCYSHDNDGAGYLIAEFSGASPLTDGTIRYNVSWNDAQRRVNHMGAVHIWSGEPDPAHCTDIRIHNNLIFSDGALSGPAIRWQSGGIADVKILNNLVMISHQAQLLDIAGSCAAFTVLGNAWFAVDGQYGGGWQWGSVLYPTFTDWAAIATPGDSSNMLLPSNPLLTGIDQVRHPLSPADMSRHDALDIRPDSLLLGAGVNLQTRFTMSPGAADYAGRPLDILKDPTRRPSIGIQELSPH